MSAQDAELLRIAAYPLELDQQAAKTEQLLNAGASVNALNRDGATALLLVAKYGTLASLEMLVAGGADVHASDEKTRNALHYATDSVGVRDDIRAVLLPQRHRIVPRLIELGVDINATAAGDSDRTPFFNAAANLPSELCTLLLDRGADPTTAEVGGSARAPIDIAVQQNNVDVVELLLGRGLAAATPSQLTFAVHQNYFAMAGRLREALGQPHPGLETPLAYLRQLAGRLGADAVASAEGSGDLGCHEREDDLDPDDLVLEYWQARYEGLLADEIAELTSQAPGDLSSAELSNELYQLYAAAFRDDM